jgi:hypothetical protein
MKPVEREDANAHPSSGCRKIFAVSGYYFKRIARGGVGVSRSRAGRPLVGFAA